MGRHFVGFGLFVSESVEVFDPTDLGTDADEGAEDMGRNCE